MRESSGPGAGYRLGLAGWVCICVLSGLFLPSNSAGQADEGLDRVRRARVLRWGGDLQGGEPYAFRDPRDGGRIVGFEVEIAEALSRRLGVSAEFVQNDWSTLLASLDRGDFDVAINGIEVTGARSSQVLFSRPYFHFFESLVVRRAEMGRFRDLEDLKSHRVGTLATSLAHDLLRAHSGIIPVLYEGVEEPFLDLELGRTDAVLIDNVIADRYGLAHPSLGISGHVGQGAYAIAVKKTDSALWAAVDSGIGDMRRDGELESILRRWNLWDRVQEGVPPLPTAEPREVRFDAEQTRLFLAGAGMTVAISSVAMLLAVSLGLALSVARQFGGSFLRVSSHLYVELFRGTPVLLQLYVLYYGLGRVFPIDAFSAAVLGLGLNYAAYEAELYRGGLSAVSRGQSEAALALGMSRGQVLCGVVFPQAFRVALPGITNDFIALLKDSSLVSVISVVELTKQMTITAVDLRSWLVPGAVCAAMYLGLSLPLGAMARRLEARLGDQS